MDDPIVSQQQSICSAPPGTEVWLCFDDGTMEGPHPVLAIAALTAKIVGEAKITDYGSGPHASTPDYFEGFADIDYMETAYLVAITQNDDNSWFEYEYIAFSEDAAAKKAEYKKEWADRRRAAAKKREADDER